MNDFAAFSRTLLHEGRVVFHSAPAEQAEASTEADAVLSEAYATYALEVAGPPVPFDLEVARAAGKLIMRACWALVNHDDRVEDLERRVSMGRGPTEASDHLSADLLLRHLPQVNRRARAISASDPLVAVLAGVLRQWPLSGVLADLEEGPLSPLDFGGHPGLCMLYAERLATCNRPAWNPEGQARAYLDLVLEAQGGARNVAVAGRSVDV